MDAWLTRSLTEKKTPFRQRPFPVVCRDSVTGHKLTMESAPLPKWWLLSSTWECCHGIPKTWSPFPLSLSSRCPPTQPSWSRGGVRTCPFSLFLSVTCYCRLLLWIVSVKSDKYSAVVIYIRETAFCRTEFSSVGDLHFEGAGRQGGPKFHIFSFTLTQWDSE